MRYRLLSKHNKQNNMKKELSFLEGFKGESLENIIDYWNSANNNNLLLSVTDNLKVKQAIDLIKRELDNNNRGTISIKELLKK
jgi:hypothetical protein